jgi:hypothetical protein
MSDKIHEFFSTDNPHKIRNIVVAVIIGIIVMVVIGSAVPATPPAKPVHTVNKPFVPDVRGLTLPKARKTLKKYGYSADPKSTDTLMAIYIEENFTVCKQDDPKGHLVPLKVAKHGC